MRPFLSVLCVGILAVVLAGPAAAQQPVKETLSATDDLVIVCDEELGLLWSTTVETTVITFSDESGNPTRIMGHARWRNTITTPDGQVLRDYEAINFVYDTAGTEAGDDDTLRVTGVLTNVHIPGEGSVVQDTGLLLYEAAGTEESELTTAGKHEALEIGLRQLLCPFFSP